MKLRPFLREARPWIVVSLVLHAVAAWRSIGFHYADEQFQIYEFAALKLGLHPIEGMPWEWRDQMRPWFHPALLVAITHACEAIGIHWARLHVFVFQLLHALLGWGATWALVWQSNALYKDARMRRLLYAAAALFWMLPWLHARVSSEGLGASLLTAAAALVLAYRSRPHAALAMGAGFAMGLTFEARYVMAVQCAALVAWLLFASPRGASAGAPAPQRRGDAIRRTARSLSWITLGGVLALALCALVDRWGYGRWTFPAWNYYTRNWVDGLSESFGTDPWWYYLRVGLEKMPPVWGVIALAALLTTWVARPLSVWTALTLSSALFHAYVPHKEIRFLYPLAAFFPWILLEALTPAPVWLRVRSAWRYRGVRGVAWALVGLNAAYLLFGALAPENNRLDLRYELLRRFAGERAITLFSGEGDPLYETVLPTYYARPRGYSMFGGLSSEVLEDLLARGAQTLPGSKSDRALYVAHPRMEPSGVAESFLRERCERVYQPFPLWLKHLNIGGWWERAQARTLWRCERPSSFAQGAPKARSKTPCRVERTLSEAGLAERVVLREVGLSTTLKGSIPEEPLHFARGVIRVAVQRVEGGFRARFHYVYRDETADESHVLKAGERWEWKQGVSLRCER